MRLYSWLVRFGIVLATALAFVGVVYAQTATPPPPTPTFRPLIATWTPVPTLDLTCPEGTPVGWGQVTPDAYWYMQCGLCAVGYVDATMTPWVTPGGATVTPTPNGPTATPTPAGCGGLYTIDYPAPTGLEFGGFPVIPVNQPASNTGYQWVGVHPDIQAGDLICIDMVFDYRSLRYGDPSDSWFKFEFGTNNGTPPIRVGLLLGGEGQYHYTDCVAADRSANAGDVALYFFIQAGGANDVTAQVLSFQATDVRVASGCENLVPPTPTPQPTATPYPGYCGTVQEATMPGGGVELGVELPIPRIGTATCYGVGEFSVPEILGITPEMNFPGFQICFVPFELGTLNILGILVDLDWFITLMAGTFVFRMMMRS